MKKGLFLMIIFALSGCVSNPRPKEIKMSEKDRTVCMYMSEMVSMLAEYRSMGYTKEHAIQETIAQKGKSGGDPQLSDFAKRLISGRAEVVYAIPEFTPRTFGVFEWGMCKIDTLHNWKIDFFKMEEIRDKIVECQNSHDDLEKHQFCVEGVIYSYVK